ncbi:GIY-YIG nuclease family protein [Cohnella herbarum]|uniref:GIY-YIG nuclease family protein n=1 Tax=Cohnella herbarum TaxID=2728023 RepID=A0A7Z2VGJ3_9BACL|nr:GIY-YIG nuclease family protein [Cohnella herbarum]QJD82647.1 GIY-YIG nuclease family protein [Cohnella herbarum]
MKSKEERANLVEQYSKIPIEGGVFQIKNTVNGKILVDKTPNFKSLNGRAVSLRLGSETNKALQKEWNEFGEDAFVMEILEVLKPSDNPFVSQKDELKKLVEHWIDKLQPFGDRGYHTIKPETNNGPK